MGKGGRWEVQEGRDIRVVSVSCSIVSSSFATPWPVACQAPPSTEFSRQEYWSGLPFPTPGIFLNKGSKPCFFHLHWGWIFTSVPLGTTMNALKQTKRSETEKLYPMTPPDTLLKTDARAKRLEADRPPRKHYKR